MKFNFTIFINHLKDSSFLKNILVVMTGTATAQVIGFAMTPIISRLFNPEDFGVFGSFNSIATIIASVATLEYSQALMLPKQKEDALHLFIFSCFSTFFIAFLCSIYCLVLPTSVNGIMKTGGIWALALLILATIISGINQSCQAWCVRSKAFKNTSASQVVRSLSASGAQIGLGFIKAGAVGLIVSSILADFLASLNLAKVVFRDLNALRQNIKWKNMIHLAQQYRDFPIYSASMNVINSLSLGLPVLLLSHFYGIAIAGAYAFSMRILSVPMSFVLTALRQVLFQKAAEVYNNGESLMPLYLKGTLGLLAMTIVPTLILYIWAPEIFVWIFGSQWLLAGEFSTSLILWMMFMFCNLPAVLFARILRIQRNLFFFNLIVLSTRAIVLITGGMYLSAIQTILLISLVGAILNILWILIIGFILKRKEIIA